MKYSCFNMSFKSFGTVFTLEKALFLLKMRIDFWFEMKFSWVFGMIGISIVLLLKLTLTDTKIGSLKNTSDLTLQLVK